MLALTSGARSLSAAPRRVAPVVIAAYVCFACLLAREVAIGSGSVVVLLAAVPLLLAIDRFPRAALVASVPAFLVNEIAHIPLLTQLLPLALAAVWALGVLTRRWRFVTSAHVPLVALLCLLLVSLKFSTRLYSPLSASTDVMTFGVGLLLCGVAASLRPRPQLVCCMIGCTGVFTAGVVVTGAFGAVSHSADALDSSGIDRVSAFGLNPNYLGIILAMGAVALLGLAVDRRQPILLLAVVPILLALPMVKSRSALIVLLSGAFVVIALGTHSRTRWVLVGTAIIALVLTPSLLRQTYNLALGSRTQADLTQSDHVRTAVAQLAIDEGLRDPLSGVGYGNFPARALQTRSFGIFLNTHNDYLRLFAEVGLPAVLCLLVLMRFAGQASLKLPRRVACTAVLCSYAAGLASANALSSLPVTAGIWVLAGAVIGVCRFQKPMARGVARRERWFTPKATLMCSLMGSPPLLTASAKPRRTPMKQG